jgi:hypothetical protein
MPEVGMGRGDPGGASGVARMARGEAVDPALVYCRTTPQFEALAGPYEWPNRSVFVASAERRPDKVRIEVFEVL